MLNLALGMILVLRIHPIACRGCTARLPAPEITSLIIQKKIVDPPLYIASYVCYCICSFIVLLLAIEVIVTCSI